MLTVKELISELEKRPSNQEVKVEGCDCVGDATYVDEMSISPKNRKYLRLSGGFDAQLLRQKRSLEY